VRRLRTVEQELVSKLLEMAGIGIDVLVLEVTDIDDGGMGSLLVGSEPIRKFGGAEIELADDDGVLAIASLYVDQHGNQTSKSGYNP
jgi:hypothetical protein